MFIQATVFDMVWSVRYLQDARGIEYAEAVIRQFSGTATGVVNFLNFTFSALLGPVFSAMPDARQRRRAGAWTSGTTSRRSSRCSTASAWPSSHVLAQGNGPAARRVAA